MIRRWRAARALRRFRLNRVAINMSDGGAFTGFLHDATGDVLVLVQASLMTEQQPIPLDGMTVIDRRQVRFMQVLGSDF